jgi:dienelactone hydrolase
LAGYGYDADRERWYMIWRPSVGAKWQRRDSPARQPPDVVPIAVAPDQQRIIALDYTRSPTGSVGYFDPSTGRTTELFPAADIEPTRYLNWGDDPQVLAVAYDGHKSVVRFFDEERGRSLEWIEAALPGTRRMFSSVSRNQTKVLLYAETDRTAGVFCLADLTAKKVTVLRSSMNGLNPASLAPSRFIRFPSSDDLMLTGRITLPAGVAQPPLIFFIGPDLHGPPSAATFDPVAQFFASRGYATARIDHRGTRGFGRTFSAAGDVQAATGMVRDFTAAKAWLAAQGWIDPERVAVVGDHLGGFVAFPLAAQPGFARVLVNLDTPTDAHAWPVNLFITSLRHPEEVLAQIGGSKGLYDYRELVDPVKVAARLTTASFHYYAQFRNGVDLTTPALEARRLEAPLKRLGKPFEFVSPEPTSRKISVQTTDWRQTAQCYESVAKFLAQQL